MVDLPLSCSVAAMVLPRTEQQSVDAFCKAMKRSEYYKLCGDERSLLKDGKEARKSMKKEKQRGGSRCPKKAMCRKKDKKRGEGKKARRKSLPEEGTKLATPLAGLALASPLTRRSWTQQPPPKSGVVHNDGFTRQPQNEEF